MQNRVAVDLYNLGRLEYKKCLSIQKYILKEKLKSPNEFRDSLILVEHDPVYTIGIRRDKYPQSEIARLRSLNAQVEATDRGGLITFHGPGQLVAYPILNLKNFNPSLKWYVKQLEQIVIDICKINYNLEAYRLCNIGYTGVWSQDKKIAAIGVHCKRYVTYHGVAINCNVDLKWFEHIVPCGIDDKKVSSLSEILGKEIQMANMAHQFKSVFESVFNVKLQEQNSEILKMKVEQETIT